MRGRTTEHAEQAAVIDWWKLACKTYKLPEFALFAIPNAGGYTGGFKKNVVRVIGMQAEGLRSGIPDLFLAMATATYCSGLFIEMKVKPNKPTPKQNKVIAYLRTEGYAVEVCYSADEAIAAIKDHLE